MERPLSVIDMGDVGLYATPVDVDSLAINANDDRFLYIPLLNIAYKDGLRLRREDFEEMAINTHKIITIEKADPRQAVLITED